MDDLEQRLASAAGRAELAQVIEEHFRLSALVADPSAIALEVVRLAERLAERMDRERRVYR